MSQILEITQLGHPILRQTAEPIQDVANPAFQSLMDSLITTAASANGVGIAAPQVAQSYRLLIIASRPSPRYPNAPIMEPTPMINPRIVAYESEKVKGWEGCLSIPGIRGLVPRYQTLEVEYLNRQGNLQNQILTDFVARIFQHELDHLDGIFFLDRLESTQGLVTEQEYQRLMA